MNQLDLTFYTHAPEPPSTASQSQAILAAFKSYVGHADALKAAMERVGFAPFPIIRIEDNHGEKC